MKVQFRPKHGWWEHIYLLCYMNIATSSTLRAPFLNLIRLFYAPFNTLLIERRDTSVRELHIYRTIHVMLSKCVLLNYKALQIKKKSFSIAFFSIFRSLRKAKIVRWLFHSCTSFEAYLTNSRIFNSKVELFAFHFPFRKRKTKILEFENTMDRAIKKNFFLS